jgi:hypothetical protein
MNLGRTVLAQLMDYLEPESFDRIVARHDNGRRQYRFSCREQFLCMVFAQLTGRESLRDIETCLRAFQGALYHSGLRSRVSRSTLAHANEHRSWEIYRAVALHVIARARVLYAREKFLEQIDAAIYALDGTIIDLCLALCPWATAANHQKTSAGVKLHTQFSIQAHLPVFARVSEANINDMYFLDDITLEPGAFYVLDRGFMDFTRLHKIDQAGAYFVIRGKSALRFLRVHSRPVDRSLGLIADQTIRLLVRHSVEGYPDCLRRIRYSDRELQRSFVFLTNNFLLEPLTICELYRARWQVELFFKWVKQHLRIKTFYGTTRNAVYTQIWIALATFVLVAIIKKELKLDHSLYTILQILSLTLFEKVPIYQALTQTQLPDLQPHDPNQLPLFTL